MRAGVRPGRQLLEERDGAIVGVLRDRELPVLRAGLEVFGVGRQPSFERTERGCVCGQQRDGEDERGHHNYKLQPTIEDR